MKAPLYLTLCAITTINAQADPFDKMESQFEQHQTQLNQEFEQHLTQQQQSFLKHLQRQWQAFSAHQAGSAFKEKKPAQAPVAPNAKKPVVQVPQSTNPPPKVEPSPTLKSQQSFILYGQHIDPPPIQAPSSPQPVNEKSITQFWQAIAPKIGPASEYFEHLFERHRAPDWLRLQIIETYSQKISNDTNQKNLISWALLNNLGIDARVGFQNSTIDILIPVQQNLYNSRYFTIAGQRYYRFSGQKGSLTLYAGSNHKRALNLSFENHPLDFFQASPINQAKLFNQNNQQRISVRSRRAFSDYFFNYPAMDFSEYFTSELDLPAKKDLITALTKATQGMSDFEKTQYLLTFVQYASNYATDNEQFGREYYALPQHTLTMQATDCEDRTFLLAYLIKHIVGQPSVALLYPGHLTLAVALNNAPKGTAAITYKDKRFYFTDPTYLGASIGMTQPDYLTVEPEIIAY